MLAGNRPTGICRGPDGAPQADGSCYQARFGATGAELWTGAASPTTDAPFSLRLTDWSCGGHSVTTIPRTADLDGATRVIYRHSGVAERYSVAAAGIEQSFVIAERPTRNGDLVLGIAVSAAGFAAAPQPAAHQSLEFRRENGDAIRYGEAVVFERGGAPVRVATRYDGGGRIELIVPADFLAKAQFPVIVDPAIGPVQSPGGPYYNDSQPDVAYEQGTQHYMVVWTRTWSTGPTDLRGQLYDEDGAPVGTMVALTGNGVSRQASITATKFWGNDSFLIAHESGDRIRCAHFRASDGASLLAPIDIGTPAAGDRDRRPCISGRSANYVGAQIAWDRTSANYTEPTQIIAAGVHVYNPTGNLVSGPEVVLDTASSGYVRNVRLPQVQLLQQVGGAAWGVSRAVWERFYPSPTPGDFDVRTAVFRTRSSNPAVMLSGPSSLSGASAIGINESLPAIAAHSDLFYSYGSDATYLIAWDEEEDVKAHRYNLTGPIGSELDIRSTSDIETEPAVAAGHTEFTVGYMQAVPPNEFSRNVRAARVLLDGTVAISDRPVDVLNGPFQDRLRAASRPVSTLANLYRNTAMLSWRGATGSGTGLNKVRLRLFEPVAPAIYPFGSPCPGPLGELPTIGTTSGPAIAGNSTFAVTIDNAPPSSLAALLISTNFTTTPIPGAPGCNLYAGLPLLDVMPVLLNVSGDGQVGLPMPTSIPNGVTLAFQWAVWTPGHNAFGWIVSNDIDINWSHF